MIALHTTEPNLIMQEIQRLNYELEVERNIEKSANKMAQLYKMEQSTNFKKGQLKDTTNTSETKIDLLNRKLKEAQEQIRLFEPRFGLLVATEQRGNATFILRSEAQREEWIKEINTLRKAQGQQVNREAEISQMEKQKSKKEGFFEEFSKNIMLKSARALHLLAKGLTGDLFSEATPSQKLLPPPSLPRNKSLQSLPLDPNPRLSVMSTQKGIDRSSSSLSELSKFDVRPPETHNFQTKSFKKPTYCDHCGGTKTIFSNSLKKKKRKRKYQS